MRVHNFEKAMENYTEEVREIDDPIHTEKWLRDLEEFRAEVTDKHVKLTRNVRRKKKN